MLSYIKKYFPILLCLLVFACKKDGSIITAQSGESGTLTANKSSLVLSKDIATDSVIQFNWTPANFGYSAAVTQTLQFAIAGTSFHKVFNFQLDNNTTEVKILGSVLNAGLSNLGLSFDTATNIEVRLASSISPSFDTSYTPSIQLKVQPYQAESYLYVIGAYSGWDLDQGLTLISPESDGTYTGTITFPSDDKLTFKLTIARNWNHSYGAGSTSSSILYDKGSDITAPGVGTYLITVNTNTLTIQYQKQ